MSMKMRTSVFIATSLDGSIAREDGAIDCLPGIDESDGGVDYGCRLSFNLVEAMVAGRNTCELVRTFDERWNIT